MFDDSLLEDRTALAGADGVLRRLAQAGARLRQETEESSASLAGLAGLPRPRAVIAAGSEARLIRTILEPCCPVPFVAWPSHGLPGWVGTLDLVVVLASDTAPLSLVATVREAVRRGCQLIIACPTASLIAEHAGSNSTTMLTTRTGDPLSAAIVMLAGLHAMHLGPPVDPEPVAGVMDQMAERCSPYQDLSVNPAKDLALCLAETQPLLWGGSVLSARVSRRIAEALRAASGRAALAAEAEELLPIIESAAPVDPFADPFEDAVVTDRRPCLVLLDDGNADEVLHVDQSRLLAASERNDVRTTVIRHNHGSGVERYAALLQTGMFASVYLAVGLGRYRTD